MTITLSDNEDGTVNQEVAYLDGFNPESQAHMYSAIMLRMASDAVGGDGPEAPEAPGLVLLG